MVRARVYAIPTGPAFATSAESQATVVASSEQFAWNVQ
jgi:hypothetical protein